MNPFSFLTPIRLELPTGATIPAVRRKKHDGRTSGAFGGPQRKADREKAIIRECRQFRFARM
jgi:hypothetical protein